MQESAQALIPALNPERAATLLPLVWSGILSRLVAERLAAAWLLVMTSEVCRRSDGSGPGVLVPVPARLEKRQG